MLYLLEKRINMGPEDVLAVVSRDLLGLMQQIDCTRGDPKQKLDAVEKTLRVITNDLVANLPDASKFKARPYKVMGDVNFDHVKSSHGTFLYLNKLTKQAFSSQ